MLLQRICEQLLKKPMEIRKIQISLGSFLFYFEISEVVIIRCSFNRNV